MGHTLLSVIKRISHSKILKASTAVWGSQSTADQTAQEAFDIIANTSEKNLGFFAGKSSRALLGGLFYLLGIRHNVTKTQKEIAANLCTSDVTIRYSYNRWLKEFPEVFQDVIIKLKEKERHTVTLPRKITSCLRMRTNYEQ